MFLLINNGPDYSKENVYSIKEDIDKPTKIGVISDLRFGSKNEQIALVTDSYRRFAKDGVKYVIDTGLYGIVRHPMYMITVFMFLMIPLILGSILSFIVFLMPSGLCAKSSMITGFSLSFMNRLANGL